MNWKKVTIWTFGVFLALIVLLAGAAVVLFRSPSFRYYLTRYVERSAGESLNSRVELRGLNLHLSPLSADLDGLAVRGAGPETNPVLLTVDHVNVRLTLQFSARRPWSIRYIEIDHPIVRVLVNQQGETNLPSPKSSNNSKTSVFDLAIQHVLLKQGEIYYNDSKTVLNADMHDVAFESIFSRTYDGGKGGYAGTFGYRDGRMVYGNYAPVPHNLEATFVATPAGFSLSPAVLTVGGSRLELRAAMRNYAAPVVEIKYEASVVGDELRRILNNSALPSGMVRISGSGRYEDHPGRSLMDSLSAQGELSSPSLLIESPGAPAAGPSRSGGGTPMRTEVRDLAASFELRNGDLIVPQMRARLLGGEFGGKLTLRELTGEARGELAASLQGISLADAQALASPASLNRVKIGGTIDANAEAKWQGELQNVVASADATIRASVARTQLAPGASASPPAPLTGSLHARYSAKAQQVSVSQSYLRTAQTTLRLEGTASERSNLNITLDSNDLHELETLAALFSSEASGPVQEVGLYGTAAFHGTLGGSPRNPQLNGQLTASHLRVHGTEWRVLRANLSASPSMVALRQGDLESAATGKLVFSVQAAMHNWSYSAADPIAIEANASQLQVADLVRAAGLHYAIAGILNAKVAIKGSQENPTGNGQLSLIHAKVSGEPIDSLNIEFQGSGEVIHASLQARAPAGIATGDLAYQPKQRHYDATFQAANLRLDKLRTPAARNMRVAGELSISAAGHGSIESPQLEATAEIPELQVQGQSIRALKLHASVENHQAQFTIESEAANTSLRAQGKIQLTGDYPLDAALDTKGIPLQPLFALYLPEQSSDINGQTELHATVRGPLKNMQRLEAHLNIPVLQLAYKDIQAGATTPLRADYQHGVVTIQPAQIKGTGTDLQLQGEIPLAGNAPNSLTLLGTVDLRLLQIVAGDVESSGQLKIDIHSRGTKQSPDLQGEVRIVNANLRSSSLPVGLLNGNGLLTLHNQRLDITEFHGQLGGGELTAQGGVAWGRGLRFDMGASANGVQVVYQGVRAGLDSNLALSGTAQAALLSGKVTVNRLSVTPDFDVSNFMSGGAGATVTTSSTGFAQSLKLNIAVQSSSELNLASKTLSARGSANLHVAGTADDPVVLGRANVTGGDLIFLGNRYIIESGTVSFINPVQTEPFLNVTANTTVQQYNIHLRLEGTLDRLRTNYSSDPALPPSDIINLLAFGSTTESAGSLNAQSALASGVSSGVTNRVEEIAGISHLSIDPALGGASNQQAPRITIQQRVTSNLFVTFASDLTSTQTQVIQVEYHFSPRWSFSTVRDQNGGFGFDFRVHKQF